MCADRIQGPTRAIPSTMDESDTTDFRSPAAGFQDFRSIGTDTRLNTSGGGCGNAEITFIATFGNPWTSDPKVELQQIKSGKWNPSTDDFSAVAKHEKPTVIQIGSFKDFVGEIQNAGGLTKKKHIKRINVVTHAVSSLIAFHGTIDATSGGVSLSNNTNWDDANKGLDTKALNDLLNLPLFLSDLRDKFCDDAEMIFYACNSGGALNKLLLDDIADTFLVKAGGFSDSVWYLPTTALPIDRNFTALGPSPPSAPPSNPQRGFKHMDSSVKRSVPKKKAAPTP